MVEPVHHSGGRAVTWLMIALKAIVLAFVLYALAYGFKARVNAFAIDGRYVPLIAYLGIWAVTYAGLLAAAVLPKFWLRLFWGLVIGITTWAGLVFREISGGFLTVPDALSLWFSRHEADRALAEYGPVLIDTLPVPLITLLVIIAPPLLRPGWLRRLLKWAFWVPALPTLALIAVIMLRPGGGWQHMPMQFQPLAVSLIGLKLLTGKQSHQRMAVPISPDGQPAVRHIILMVDESVRADYLDFSSGNRVTPHLPALRERIADFGQAASGGNCSNYANAILRFTAQPHDMIRSVQTYPTLWQWAKRGGFRTIYLNAQLQYALRYGRTVLGNFMTLGEVAQIDDIVNFSGIPAARADMVLIDRLARLLRESKQPLFIYINKNGAHFPYDASYPAERQIFRPTFRELKKQTLKARINSYRNAIAWSVDLFLHRLMKKVDLSDTLIIHTSDHGQNLRPGRLTHCSTRNPDPREALVPMLAITANARLLERFKAAARRNRNLTSHFHIAPTLLALMGYDLKKAPGMYGPSLLDDLPRKHLPAFSYGDIFGYYTNRVNWGRLDTFRDYLEPYARRMAR